MSEYNNSTSTTTEKEHSWTRSGQACPGSKGKRFCRPSHYNQLKWVKNRGAVLVLVWSFLIWIILNYLVNIYNTNNLLVLTHFRIHPSTVVGAVTLVYPLLGWLADVYFGRYKVIRCSLWVMWFGTMCFTLGSIIYSLFTEPGKNNLHVQHSIKSIATPILYIVVSLGLGGFQANIVQFGIDQLLEASSSEITSFVRWYIWTFISSNLLVSFIFSCIGQDGSKELICTLLLPIATTLALCLNSLFNGWLVKEPITQNPLKFILKVLRYAVKHKHPRNRSAFTYWEDKPITRIDLAKSKYGGPFTTEQVEDVKTFLRLLVIFSISSISVGLFINIKTVTRGLAFHLYDSSYKQNCSSVICPDCFGRIAVERIGHYAIFLSIPAYEFIVYPLYRRQFAEFSIMNKFTIGMSLILLDVIGNLVIESVGHHIYLSHNGNTTIKCLLTQEKEFDPNHALSISYQWLAIPNFLGGVAQYFILGSTVEFICSQSPYSMKGLIFGVMYGTIGVMTFLTLLLFLPFSLSKDKWNTLHIQGTVFGCGFWILFTCTILMLISIFLFCLVKKWYKKRRRDENVHNEHIFAVNYYDHYNSIQVDLNNN